ncbi:MAG TPA: Crp/Fnr family transcriptional regulator [Candidatus Limnocylindria bacterium]|nr:Crp/Fnr family transcriptional regulator [Candidatus Limnocylindria bacterium]
MEAAGSKAIAAAVAKSALARLSPEARARLLDTAHRVDLPPGGHLFDEDSPPRLGLLISGVTRGYRTLPDGRQLTFFYDHAGSLPGLVLAFGRRAPGTVEALTQSTVMLFPVDVVRALLQSDGDAALVLTEEFATRAIRMIEELTGHVMGSLRERVGHHLLASAVISPRLRLVAELTQQDIADATGAARESVSRTLRDLERDGVIKIRPRRIEVLNADALCPNPASRPLAMIS